MQRWQKHFPKDGQGLQPAGEEEATSTVLATRAPGKSDWGKNFCYNPKIPTVGQYLGLGQEERGRQNGVGGGGVAFLECVICVDWSSMVSFLVKLHKN
jgi:hypothetical protein